MNTPSASSHIQDSESISQLLVENATHTTGLPEAPLKFITSAAKSGNQDATNFIKHLVSVVSESHKELALAFYTLKLLGQSSTNLGSSSTYDTDARIWAHQHIKALCHEPFDFSLLAAQKSEMLNLLFNNCGTIQLTEGCSIGCAFCGFNAPKGVTDI